MARFLESMRRQGASGAAHLPRDAKAVGAAYGFKAPVSMLLLPFFHQVHVFSTLLCMPAFLVIVQLIRLSQTAVVASIWQAYKREGLKFLQVRLYFILQNSNAVRGMQLTINRILNARLCATVATLRLAGIRARLRSSTNLRSRSRPMKRGTTCPRCPSSPIASLEPFWFGAPPTRLPAHPPARPRAAGIPNGLPRCGASSSGAAGTAT